MEEKGKERCLWLEEEEAMGLLDIVMLSPGELTPEQRVAVLKLSEFCRQFIREEDGEGGRTHGSSSVFIG